MKVMIDRSGCIGCGLCATTCPEVFELDSEGLAEVIGPPEGYENDVKEAADGCPVEVIHTED